MPARILSFLFFNYLAPSKIKVKNYSLKLIKKEKRKPPKSPGRFWGDKGGFLNTLKFWVILLTAVSKIGTQNLAVFKGKEDLIFLLLLFFLSKGKNQKY